MAVTPLKVVWPVSYQESRIGWEVPPMRARTPRIPYNPLDHSTLFDGKMGKSGKGIDQEQVDALPRGHTWSLCLKW